MLNLHVSPLLFEVFGDKAAMTVMRLILTAKEATAV
jgi:hypothetical protein